MRRPTAAEVIARLGLTPHPEGGHYRELHRAASPAGGRSPLTSIHYLLRAGEVSAWHRVRTADEVWYFQAGDALELRIAAAGANGHVAYRLGPDVLVGDLPQAVVPAGHWQSARPLGRWSLVGCAVAPGFEFDDFELAPAGFDPPPRA